MKPIKEKDFRDLKIKAIECRRYYITKAMEFRRRMLQIQKRKKLGRCLNNDRTNNRCTNSICSKNSAHNIHHIPNREDRPPTNRIQKDKIS